MTKRWRMHEVLREAGRQEPPPPRPEFRRDLEGRLGITRVVVAPAATRGPWRAIGAVAAAAAVIVAAVLLRVDTDDEARVTTEPSTSSTSSTSTTSTSTTTSTTVVETTTTITAPVAPAVTTTSMDVPPAPTTTVAPPPETTTTSTTNTTEPPTTTSTTEQPRTDLNLQCVTRNDTGPIVVCEWSASNIDGFDHYRLWKHTGDGPDQEVYTGTDRRHEDHERVGARLIYEVTAVTADGRVIGHGQASITCC